MTGSPGAWPAFWTLGADYSKVGWPACGEIDVMEAVNRLPNLYGSLHGPYSDGQLGAYNAGKMLTPRGGLAHGWHVYTARWTRRSVSFEFDGHVYAVVDRSRLPHGSVWALTHPQQLLLNIAVGGSMPGRPAVGQPFRAEMMVDWVRVSH
jgi:beta-glucanase (GH16 family)